MRRPSFVKSAPVFLAGLMMVASVSPSDASIQQRALWDPDGPVFASVSRGDTLYLGGGFTQWRPVTGSLVMLDRASGVVQPRLPAVDGTVRICIADSAGGWFVGGKFPQIGGKTHANLAHVLPDGSVDDWDPRVEGEVTALLKQGDRLYVGGPFSRVDGQASPGYAIVDSRPGPHATYLDLRQSVSPPGGQGSGEVNTFQPTASGQVVIGGWFSQITPRNGAWASIDSATGRVGAQMPRVEGCVRVCIPDGNGGWYLGGKFDQVGGLPRANLAHVLADLSVGAWNPGADDSVSTLVIGNGLLYAGGGFTVVGGQPRARLAAFDANTGALSAWDPGADADVRALVATPTRVYAGGAFTSAGGQTRNSLAALDVGTGAATSWDPNVNAPVNALILDGDRLLVGGEFTKVGAIIRRNIAALDTISASPTSWDPNASGFVYSMALVGDTLYTGGSLIRIGGQFRNRIASIHRVTGLATAWNPGCDNTVLSVLPMGEEIVIGGEFMTAGGLARGHLARISVATGAVQPWEPNCTGTVCALAVGPSGQVLVGARGSGIGGRARQNLAIIDPESGLVMDWNVPTNGGVSSSVLVGDTLVICGGFSTVGGQSRVDIAGVRISTNLVLSWPPSQGGWPYFVTRRGDELIVGGKGMGTRGPLLSYSLSNGALTDWAPAAPWGATWMWNGDVRAVAFSGDTMFVAGDFGDWGGQPRRYLAAVDANTGVALPWDPKPNNRVSGLLVAPGEGVVASGDFTGMGGVPRLNLAAIDARTGALLPWAPGANGVVRAMSIADSVVYAAGEFTAVNGQARSIAAVNAFSGDLLPWSPGIISDPIHTLALAGNTLYAGGQFLTAAGQARSRLAAFDRTTATLLPWNPGADNIVNQLAIAGSRLFAIGSFTQLGGQSRSRLGSFDLPGGTITSWNPSPNNTVLAIAAAGSTLYVAGGFSRIGGFDRVGIAAVNIATQTVTPWNPVTKEAVNRLAVTSDRVYASSWLTTTNTLDRKALVALDRTSGALLSWDPQLSLAYGFNSGYVLTHLNVTPSGLFLSGSITTVEGQRRLAAALLLLPSALSVPSSDSPTLRASVLPNPFRSSVTLRFTLARAEETTLQLFDIAGREVARPLDRARLSAGPHDVLWPARSLEPGLYWYRIQAGQQSAKGRLIHVK